MHQKYGGKKTRKRLGAEKRWSGRETIMVREIPYLRRETEAPFKTTFPPWKSVGLVRGTGEEDGQKRPM